MLKSREIESELFTLKYKIEEIFKIDNIFKKTRKKEYVDARKIFVLWLYRKYSQPFGSSKKLNGEAKKITLKKVSLHYLALYMGYSDNHGHGTVINLYKKAEDHLSTDVEFKDKWELFLYKSNICTNNISISVISKNIIKEIKKLESFSVSENYKLEIFEKELKNQNYELKLFSINKSRN